MKQRVQKLKKELSLAGERVGKELSKRWQWVKRKGQSVLVFLDRHPKAKKLAIVTGIPAGLFLVFMLFIVSQTPSGKALKGIRNAVASEVYSADSVLLGRYYLQDRTEIAYEDIPPVVTEALLATEDVRYYDHMGIDIRSLGRVLVKSILLQDESAGGGSTITQQLAKNLFPRKRYLVGTMLVNKFREAFIAFRLELLYTKEEILVLYLNTIPFADNTYGIESASRRFFSTSTRDLSIEQAAVLVGMLKATHYYNPRLYPEQARSRRNVVLAQMAKYGRITPEKRDSLQQLPLTLQYQKGSVTAELAPYFTAQVKNELLRWCETNRRADGEPYNLYTDGLRIYTTLDSRLQRYAETAMARQMEDVQQQFFDHWGKIKPWNGNTKIIEEAVVRSARYRKYQEEGLDHNTILEKMKQPVPTRIFTWQGSKEVEMSPLDSIEHHMQFLNAGFLAVDPSAGHVKAWVGGIDHAFFQYDHVRESTRRQVGSIFKPIVFSLALEQGMSPCELIPAAQETYITETGKKWTPGNTQYDYDVEYSMRGALAYSVNTVSVKLIHRAGIENTIRLARAMGIKSEMEEDASISLGSSSLSMMEMAAAYSCLANGGVSSEPYYIASIVDRKGKVYDSFRPEASGKRVLSEETSNLVRHMLQTVVQEGTASRLRWKYGIYNDVAGKTGTTQDNADGWFMAMTPNLVMASWVGADDPRIHFRYTSLGQGSNTALPIVAYFLKQVNEDSVYAEVAQARFQPLDPSIRKKLNCDLYELNDDLIAKIERTVWQRDSLITADSLAAPPPETFLQRLYKRKMRMLFASQGPNDIGQARVSEEESRN